MTHLKKSGFLCAIICFSLLLTTVSLPNFAYAASNEVIIRSSEGEPKFTTTGTWSNNTSYKLDDGSSSKMTNVNGATATFHLGSFTPGKYIVWLYAPTAGEKYNDPAANIAIENPNLTEPDGKYVQDFLLNTKTQVPNDKWVCLTKTSISFLGDGNDTITFTCGSTTGDEHLRLGTIKLVPAKKIRPGHEFIVELPTGSPTTSVAGVFPTFELSGKWERTSQNHYLYGDSSKPKLIHTSVQNAYARFYAAPLEAGEYDVYYYNTRVSGSMDANARLNIFHNNILEFTENDGYVLNMDASENDNRWIKLTDSPIYFDGSGDEYVEVKRIDPANADKVTRIGAVKFVKPGGIAANFSIERFDETSYVPASDFSVDGDYKFVGSLYNKYNPANKDAFVVLAGYDSATNQIKFVESLKVEVVKHDTDATPWSSEVYNFSGRKTNGADKFKIFVFGSYDNMLPLEDVFEM